MEEPIEIDWIEWFKVNCPKISATFRDLFAANLLENQVIDVDSLKENLEIDPTFLKTVIGVKNAVFELSIKASVERVPECMEGSFDVTTIVSTSPLTVCSDSLKEEDPMRRSISIDVPGVPAAAPSVSASNSESIDASRAVDGIEPISRTDTIDNTHQTIRRLSISTADGFKPAVNVGDETSPLLIPINNVTLFRSTTETRDIYFGEYTVAKRLHQVVIKKELNDKVNEMEHEAQVLADLAAKGSKCVVELLYYSNTLPYYVVLERFGESLSAYLHRDSAIKEQMLEQLVLSVKGLHGDGYVHCDLKPENVLVHMQAGVIKVKLCDLDSARKVGDLFPYDEESGGLKYTYEWVSPEVYFGSGGVTRAQYGVDIFALGLIAAVLFDDEVFSGKTILPSAMEHPSIMESFLSDQEVLWSNMPCQFKPRCKSVIHSMCHIDPAKRATLMDVIRGLQLTRATAYQNRAESAEEKNAELHKHNAFLKEEVIDKQNQMISKLDASTELLKSMGNGIRDILRQNGELRNLVDSMVSGFYDCPTLFVYVPEVATKWVSKLNPLRLVRDKFRLFFMCAHTKRIVPCGPEGNGYPVTTNKAWVIKAAPYLKLGLVLLKEVLDTYKVPLPIAPVMGILEDSFDLHMKYIDTSLQYIADTLTEKSATPSGNSMLDVSYDLVPETETKKEIKNIHAANVSTKEAYECVKAILQRDNYWNSVQSTCGLVQTRYRGNISWILGTEEVKKSYEAATDKAELQRATTESAAAPAGSVQAYINQSLNQSAVPPAKPPKVVTQAQVSPPPPVVRPISVSIDTAPPPPAITAAGQVQYAAAPSPLYHQVSPPLVQVRTVSGQYPTPYPPAVAGGGVPYQQPYAAAPPPPTMVMQPPQYPPQGLNAVYRPPPAVAPQLSQSSAPSAVEAMVAGLQIRPPSTAAVAAGGVVLVQSGFSPTVTSPTGTPGSSTVSPSPSSSASVSQRPVDPRYRPSAWTCCLRCRQTDPGCFGKKNAQGVFETFHIGTFRPEPIVLTDRNIMVAFYNTTEGGKWFNSTNWCTNQPLNTWFGLKCHPSDPNKVVEIEFRNNNIKGCLLEEFALLTDLKTLRIDGSTTHSIVGELPVGYGALKNLKKLSLKNNRCTGRVPDSWAAMKLEKVNMASLNPLFAATAKTEFKRMFPRCALNM